MRLYQLFFFMISVMLSGCGGDGDADVGPENTDTTYINSVSGADIPGNGRSRDIAYKTITYALLQSDTRSTIELANGTYNTESGEQFPIVLTGKKLIGESVNIALQQYALIAGTGIYESQFVNGDSDVSVVFDGALEIRDLAIEANTGTALWVENAATNSLISNIRLSNSAVGMVIVGNAAPQINQNIIEQNLFNGAEIRGQSKPTFSNNNFINNGVGISVTDSAHPSFGAASGGGNNVLLENFECDFLHSGTEDLNVIGTKWDQDVFDFSIENSCSDGAEIVVSGGGSINFQFIPPENNLVFQNTNRIALEQPSFGERIFTQEPQFVWSSTGPNISMIAAWEQPPVIGVNEILNSVPIYWFWHSGLKTGGNGFARHSDGRAPIDGDIENSQAPIPFQAGRSYYWAVWEWDETSRNIVASSSLNYFRVD